MDELAGAVVTPEAVAATLVQSLMRPRGVKIVEKTGAARTAGLVDYATLRECVYSVRSCIITRLGYISRGRDCASGSRLSDCDLPWATIEADLERLVVAALRAAAAVVPKDISSGGASDTVDLFTWVCSALFCAACQKIPVPHGRRGILKKKGNPDWEKAKQAVKQASQLIGTLKRVLIKQMRDGHFCSLGLPPLQMTTIAPVSMIGCDRELSAVLLREWPAGYTTCTLRGATALAPADAKMLDRATRSASNAKSKCAAVLRVLEAFGDCDIQSTEGDDCCGGDGKGQKCTSMLPHLVDEFRLQVLRYCIASGNLSLVRERFCDRQHRLMKNGMNKTKSSSCSHPLRPIGRTATRGAIALVRTIIWGAVLKSVGFDNAEQAVDVLASAELIPDLVKSDGGERDQGMPLALPLLVDAANRAAFAWQGEQRRTPVIKANIRTLLQLAEDVLDYQGGATNIAGRLRKGVSRLAEMNILLQYCRKNRWEAAEEYAEGNDKLCKLLANLRASYSLQRAKARARERFGMELPDELVRVGNDLEDDIGSGGSGDHDCSLVNVSGLWKPSKRYLDLGLSLKSVTWVEAARDMRMSVSSVWRESLAELLVPGGVVGIDLEWRDPNPAALLQLGTRDNAVLFDLLPLINKAEPHSRDSDDKLYRAALVDFLTHFFENGKIVKVAYGFENDYRRLRQVIPEMPTYEVAAPKVQKSIEPTKEQIYPRFAIELVDFERPPRYRGHPRAGDMLSVLAPQRWSAYKAQWVKHDTCQQQRLHKQRKAGGIERKSCNRVSKVGTWSPGLSHICEEAFGLALDKGNQCSNWEVSSK